MLEPFNIQGGPKKIGIGLEEKYLRNSKIFFNEHFLYPFSHLIKKLELSKLCRKKYFLNFFIER